jgi:hypothetical protein
LNSSVPPIIRVLVAGETVEPGFRALPGVALLPAVGSRSSAPVAPALRLVRRAYCWRIAVSACRDVGHFIGIDAPLWARFLVERRRRQSMLSEPDWVDDPAVARSIAAAVKVDCP